MDDQTEVVKIFGGPGTGKTTTIVGNSDIENFQGILHRMFSERDAQSVMLIAYTRAAKETAKDRLEKTTNVPRNILAWRITTIHGLTMRMNNVKPDDIVELRWGKGDRQEFCNLVGLEYSNTSDDDDDIMDTPDDDGHLFFRMLGWLKANMLPMEEWDQCPVASEWQYGDEFVDFQAEWLNYKIEEEIWEFDDVIKQSVEEEHTVEADDLFVDEVQDLYPLQQAFLDNQFGVVDRIWLAGDDDQTIFEWSGANPDYFINMEGRLNGDLRDELWDDKQGYWADEGVYILDQSFRMPKRILELSQMCIERVSVRQEKTIKPHTEGGEFIALPEKDMGRIIRLLNLDDSFCLFRSNHLANQFGKELLEEGVPFEDRFKTWRDETVKVRNAMSALYNEEPIGGDDAAQVISYLDDNLIMSSNTSSLASKYTTQETVDPNELVNKVRLDYPKYKRHLDRWMDTMDDLNYYQQMGVRNNIVKNRDHLDPDGLIVETIHWSKGREADTVLLSMDTTNSVMQNCPGFEPNDAERRLCYVGMTRTERRLIMAENIDEYAPTWRISDFLGSQWRERHDYLSV